MILRRLTTLTARIVLLFSLTALVTLAGIGAYLYQSLEAQLKLRDDHELLGKVDQLRYLLTRTASVEAIQKDPHRFYDATGKHEGLIVILHSVGGLELMRSGMPGSATLPPLKTVAANIEPSEEDLISWQMDSGASARVVAAWGKLKDQDSEVRIILSRTDFERTSLLASYKQDVLFSMLAGIFLAALLGYLVVRASLRPVRHIASQARSISAQQLDKRLNASAAPGELQVLVESFNAVLNRLQESFQRLSQFSADLAHDMRTPLNNLMMQSQVALSHPRSQDEYQALLGSNLEEYERLARMVESMLFLARADHAQIALDRQMLDAHEEMHRIAEYFEGVAEEKGVHCKVDIEADPIVWADPVLFRRAVNNLMANAIRYTPEGGMIRLLVQPGVHGQVVSVANPGPGIDKPQQKHIFDRFYRADQARAESATSAGLGLAIVQTIMKLHGGTAEVDSEPGRHTVFRLFFPHAPEPSPMPANTPIREKVPTQGERNNTWLK